MFMRPILLTIFYEYNSISILLAGDLETELLNSGLKIYGNKDVVKVITCLVNEYPSIYEFLGFL